MEARLKLKPGQRGTKKLLAQYGDRLVCVRYRYDAARKRRYKTVELIVAEVDWEPPQVRAQDIVMVRTRWNEAELVKRLREAGAIWDARRARWSLRFRLAKELGLEDRIILPEKGIQQ